MPGVDGSQFTSLLKYASGINNATSDQKRVSKTFFKLPFVTGQTLADSFLPRISNLNITPPLTGILLTTPPILNYTSGSTVSFPAVPGATNYKLYNNATDALIADLGTNTTFSIPALITPPANLSPNTSYTVYVVASNPLGPSPKSATITFTTPPAPPTMTISGTSLVIPSSTGASSYRLISSPPIVPTPTIGPGTTSFTSLGLTPGVLYTLSVATTGANGIESLGGTTIEACIPANPGTSTVGSTTATSVTLNLIPPSIGPATGYNVYQNGVLVPPSRVTFNGTTATVTGLVPGSTNTFTSSAYFNNPSNESTQSPTITVYTPPLVPGTVTPGTVTGTTAVVNWSPPSSGGVTGYNIYQDGVLVPPSRITITGTSATITGLTPGSTSNITVKAYYNTSTNESPATASVAITTVTTPPTNLVVSAITTTTLTIDWTAPIGGSVTGYRVYQNSVLLASPNISIVGTKAYISGLSTGTQYTYYATSYVGSPSNESANSTSVTIYTALNNSPGALLVSVVGTTASLSWGASSGTVTGYNVYQGGALVTPATRPSATSATITGLSAATTYQFYIKAYHPVATNESPANPTVEINTAPSTPGTLTSTGTTAFTTTLNWGPSSSNVSGYNVYQNGTLISPVFPSATSASITGLNSGTAYQFYVKAYYNTTTNESPANNTITVNTVPNNTPGVLTSTSISTTGVTLNWGASSGSVTGYSVYQNGLPINTLSANTLAVTGLTPGTTYNYYVKSYFSTVANESPANTSLPVYTKPNDPGTLTSSNLSSSGVTLSWLASSGTVTGYNVYKDDVLISPPPTFPTATSATITGLDGGVTYKFYIKAYYINRTNESAQNTFINITTIPSSTPGNIVATNVTTSSVNLAWGAVTGTVTGYNLYQNNALVSSLFVTGRTATLTNLTPGNTYDYYVKGFVTTPSNETGASPTTTVYTQPNAPGAVTSSTTTTSGTTLSWSVPLTSGVSGYSVYQNGSKITPTITGTTATITGLTAGTNYSYFITAYFNTATNESSPNSTIQVYTVPTSVTNLATSNVTTTGLSLTWTAPSVGSATGYRVYQNSSLITPTISGTTATITGLSVGTNYSYYVVTYYNAIGNVSVASASLSAYTSPGVPGAVVSSSTTSNGTTLTWSAPSSGGSTGYNVYQNGVLVTPASRPTATSATITGLNSGTAYTYYIKTYYNTTTNESAANTTITVDTVPNNSPGPIVASNVTNGGVTLNWGASTGTVSGYNLYQNGQRLSSTVVAGTNAVITGLVPGSNYAYYVTAFSVTPNNETAPNNTIQVYTIPDSPATLTSSAVTNSSVSLSWSVPSQGTVSGYTVYQNGTLITPTITGTTASITGLTAGTNYSYFVRSYYNTTPNISAPSNTVQVYTVPVAPGTVTSSATTISGTTLTWSAPSVGSATGYNVYQNGSLITPTISGTTATITGLTAGTMYSYYITAYYNAVGNASPANSTISVYTAPNAPGTVTSSSPTDVGATLTWSAPSGGVTGYKIYNGPAIPANLYTTVSTSPLVVGSGGLTQLSSGLNYTFNVTSYYNTTSNESTAQSVNFTTVSVINPPTNVQITAQSDTTVTLTWTPPATGNKDGYYINTTTPSGSPLTFTAPGAAASTTVLTGLTSGTTYVFNIFTYFGTTSQRSSAVIVPIAFTSPAPPTGVSATPVMGGATLNWNAQSLPINADIIGYKIYDVSSGGTSSYTVAKASPLSQFITGLSSNTNYTYYIAGYGNRNSIPVESTRASVSFTTPILTPPTNGALLALGSTTATISWNSLNNGETGYNIYNGNNLYVTIPSIVSSVALGSGSYSQLLPATTQTFNIKAYYGLVTAETPPLAITFTTFNTYSPPTNATITSLTETTATLTWTPASGGPYDGYFIVVVGAADYFYYTVTGSGTSTFTATGLPPGNSVRASIYTYKGSPTLSFNPTFNNPLLSINTNLPLSYTLPTPPINPVSSSVTNTTATISWTTPTTPPYVNNNVYKYNIYDGTTFISFVNSNVTTYDLTGLNANNSYTFNIKSVLRIPSLPDVESVPLAINFSTGLALTLVVGQPPPTNITRILSFVSSDSTGQYALAVDDGSTGTSGEVWFSNDYGLTWKSSTPSRSAYNFGWVCCSLSADGNTAVIANGTNGNYGAYICTTFKTQSSGSLLTWNRLGATNTGSLEFNAVKISGNGTKIYLAGRDGGGAPIYVSTYSGGVWGNIVELAATRKSDWSTITCSYDGNYVYASQASGAYGKSTFRYRVGISTDLESVDPENFVVRSVVCSDDGRLVYTVGQAELRFSSNYGAYGSWIHTVLASSFYKLACSANGSILYLIDSQNGSNLIISKIVDQTITIPLPLINIANAGTVNPRGISMSCSANGSKLIVVSPKSEIYISP